MINEENHKKLLEYVPYDANPITGELRKSNGISGAKYELTPNHP